MSESSSEKEQKNTEEPNVEVVESDLPESEVIEKEAVEVGKVVVKAIKEEFSEPIPHPDIIEANKRIFCIEKTGRENH